MQNAIITNRLIPLEKFLPPTDISNIYALMTEDWNGLNNGAFYLRVSAWSVEMLPAVISQRTFRPEKSLPSTEQSAMAAVLRETKVRRNVTVMPSTWFNVYPSEWSPNGVSYLARQGDMVLHSAGVNQKGSTLHDWRFAVAQEPTSWKRPSKDTTLAAEAQGFGRITGIVPRAP
jgi:hypothetical protein